MIDEASDQRAKPDTPFLPHTEADRDETTSLELSSFSFGDNWQQFSTLLDESRVTDAERSLCVLLGRPTLNGLSLLDIGSGSGLFAIAAARLGARRVVAIDRDRGCLLAARRNAAAFLTADRAQQVVVREGDILKGIDEALGRFDIVYAWGSLHHTGNMWRAIENAAAYCAPGGLFVLAIYNATTTAPAWLRIKRFYNASPWPFRYGMVAALSAARGLMRVLRGKHPFRVERGMSVWYDAIDWLGGLPYEYATPDAIDKFLVARGFEMIQSVLTRRSGCNEFVYRLRTTPAATLTRPSGAA
jgi:2-polyprenyl-3-methyl-5-hydroxy-6-metoxy-1,4-benzoquinol methylase